GAPRPSGAGTPPAAAKATSSASSERSRRRLLNVSLSAEFSAVAKPVVPGKKTPMPPTTAPFLNRGMPPGRVAMPRDWADGIRPDTKPYDSGAGRFLPGGMNAGLTLKRLGSGRASAGRLLGAGRGEKRRAAVGWLWRTTRTAAR